MAARTEWVFAASVLKRSEGGTGVADAIRVLKKAGVPARSEPSAYVGHVILAVAKGKLTAARAALRPYGWRF